MTFLGLVDVRRGEGFQREFLGEGSSNMKKGANSGGAELPLHEGELFYVCDKAPNQNACRRTFKGKYVAHLFFCVPGQFPTGLGLNTSRGDILILCAVTFEPVRTLEYRNRKMAV